MLCAIWFHLYNLKIVKKPHGKVLLLVRLQAHKKINSKLEEDKAVQLVKKNKANGSDCKH